MGILDRRFFARRKPWADAGAGKMRSLPASVSSAERFANNLLQPRACGHSLVDRVAAERGWVQGARPQQGSALQERATQQTVPFSDNPQGRPLATRRCVSCACEHMHGVTRLDWRTVSYLRDLK